MSSSNFIIAPWVLTHGKLTSPAKLVYAVLRTNSKDMKGYSLAITTHRRICTLLGMDIRTLRKALNSLIDLRIVSEIERGFTVRHNDPSYDDIESLGESTRPDAKPAETNAMATRIPDEFLEARETRDVVAKLRDGFKISNQIVSLMGVGGILPDPYYSEVSGLISDAQVLANDYDRNRLWSLDELQKARKAVTYGGRDATI